MRKILFLTMLLLIVNTSRGSFFDGGYVGGGKTYVEQGTVDNQVLVWDNTTKTYVPGLILSGLTLNSPIVSGNFTWLSEDDNYAILDASTTDGSVAQKGISIGDILRIFSGTTDISYLSLTPAGNLISFGNTTSNQTVNFETYGLTTFNGNITIDRLANSADAVITFDGSSNDPEALTYESDNNKFNFSTDLDVTGNLLVSGDLNVNNNVRIGDSTAPTALLHLAAGTTSLAPLKLTAGPLLTTPSSGSIEYYGNKTYITNKDLQKVIDRTSDVKLTTTTVANTTDETEVYEASVPANSWVAGNVLKMLISGTLSNKVGSSGHTVTVKVYVGTTEAATITSTEAKFTDVCWHISGYNIVRDIGSTGHMAYHLEMTIDGDNSNVTCNVVEIDTTGLLDITVTATWASADDANIFTCNMGLMEYKN